MKRRQFLKLMSLCLIQPVIPYKAFAGSPSTGNSPAFSVDDDHIKDYLCKIRNFDEDHEGDIFLEERCLPLLYHSLQRLLSIQKTVGHGHFALMSIDQALKTARSYPSIGAFSNQECDFLEMLFYKDGSQYGFFGNKPLPKFTAALKRQNITKISGTGNYLYKGKPVQSYLKIKQMIGDDIILTSGLRSVTKQFMLFLKKTAQSRGNLSRASRSLAPPGYSYHGVGDFDVGQIGYGIDNFTVRFTETDVYKKMIDSGLTRFRYTKNNHLGVRFEPWHIQVS